MPAKNKSAKAAKKSVKMRDLKPAKDAKGGSGFHTGYNPPIASKAAAAVNASR